MNITNIFNIHYTLSTCKFICVITTEQMCPSPLCYCTCYTIARSPCCFLSAVKIFTNDQTKSFFVSAINYCHKAYLKCSQPLSILEAFEYIQISELSFLKRVVCSSLFIGLLCTVDNLNCIYHKVTERKLRPPAVLYQSHVTCMMIQHLSAHFQPIMSGLV